MSVATPIRIEIIAGEISGDLLGASVMAALKLAVGSDDVYFSGIGGSYMQAEGLRSHFPMQELSLMGLAEVLPHIVSVQRRIRETATRIEQDRPDAVLTIDAPGFCFRVAKRLKARSVAVPIIHMVAPQTWAWREGRAAKLNRYIDHLLALLPFEAPIFEAHGLHTTFVGHPLVERAGTLVAGDATSGFRLRHGLSDDAPVLLALPGSRFSEVRRLLPVLGQAVDTMARTLPSLVVAIPTVAVVAEEVRTAAAQWAAPSIVIEERNQHGEAFAAGAAAIAASGTVVLELALWQVPTVVIYRANPITVAVVRKMLRTEFVALPNILSGREVMPELIQEDCRPDKICRHVLRLLTDKTAHAEQQSALAVISGMLGANEAIQPSERAAQAVLDTIKQNRISLAELS